MVHPENLRPGMWVCISDAIAVPGEGTSPRCEYNGYPLRVVAVSFPFVVVDGVRGGRSTVDLRRWGVTVVNDGYVRTFRARQKRPAKAKRRAGAGRKKS